MSDRVNIKEMPKTPYNDIVNIKEVQKTLKVIE